MRKLAAASLLLLVLACTFGTGAAWLLAWQQARRAGKARLKAAVPAAERVTVRLTAAQLADARVDDHEVRLDGRMYDILREATTPNRTIALELLPDHAEDRLFAHLDQLVASLLASKTQQGKQLRLPTGLPLCCLPAAACVPAVPRPSVIWGMPMQGPLAPGFRPVPEQPPRWLEC